LFGHSHGNLPSNGKSFDVGVDAVAKRLSSLYNLPLHPNFYRPISFTEVEDIMDTLIVNNKNNEFHHD